MKQVSAAQMADVNKLPPPAAECVAGNRQMNAQTEEQTNRVLLHIFLILSILIYMTFLHLVLLLILVATSINCTNCTPE